MRNNYIYAVLPKERFAHYWNGTGWTEKRLNARRFTEAEAEAILRPMMLDNIKAKIGRF